ncbi:MAG: hypothetical protein ABIM50_11530 [Novosphingobium sp.]
MTIALVSDGLRVHADRAGLDARLNIPYLSRRMTRLLLTLLALLTGLVAQSAPTQARVVASAGSEVTVQQSGVSKRIAIVSQIVSRPASGSAWQLQRVQVIAPQRIVLTPTVLPGIDRARE